MADRYLTLEIEEDGGLRGTYASEFFPGRGHSFSADLALLIIRHSWEDGLNLEREADGFGPGFGTGGDWSAIRDSSRGAKAEMLRKALNRLFPLDPAKGLPPRPAETPAPAPFPMPRPNEELLRLGFGAPSYIPGRDERVRINGRLKPAYLRGRTGTAVKVNTATCDVRLDDTSRLAQGYVRKDGTIRVPLSCLEPAG